MSKLYCFENKHCFGDCPNILADMADERFGYGIADDMGYQRIDCKNCDYNTGKCSNCLFEYTKDCPKGS